MAAPTDQDGHKHATDPLLNHLLYLWFGALGHDSESVSVGDRAHGGGAQPGDPKDGGDPPHGDQEEQIKMEAGSFHHFPLGFAHNQPGDPEKQMNQKLCRQQRCSRV